MCQFETAMISFGVAGFLKMFFYLPHYAYNSKLSEYQNKQRAMPLPEQRLRKERSLLPMRCISQKARKFADLPKRK